MGPSCQRLVLLLAVIVLGLSLPCSNAIRINKVKTKTSVYLSPKFVLEPGSVADKYFYNIEFPRGHVAIKYFNAEVVDEDGNPVPLHESYLHHWVLDRYFARKSYIEPEQIDLVQNDTSDVKLVRNSGPCQGDVLGQYYGLGSETRKTDTRVPDPFGIEIGNAADIPDGFEERWLLNVHAIDTRGVVDRLGCTECRCDLYNVTKDGRGLPLRPGYTGGLHCCYDDTHCSVKQGYNGVKRSLYLRYTVKWVDWSDSIVPVKIYIFDVTDKTIQPEGSSALVHDCRVEYNVEPCSAVDTANDRCFHNQQAVATIPTGGYIVYGVAHQHTGGLGATLYREDGRAICSSIPIYGQSEEAGDEAGYITGMSTCYPRPGSVPIKDGETLIVRSNYSSSELHTGVMGLFYILVAENLPYSSTLSSLDSSL